jgi:hypothetical protein
MFKLFNFFKRPLGQIVLVIAMLAVFGGAGWGIYQTQIPPEQPIQFKHNLHVGLGVQCLYCHTGAWRGQSAGLPTQAKCWGCHQQLKATQTEDGWQKKPELMKLRDYVQNNEIIPWVPVAILPDFVYFAHRPHVAAGLNCENCHGDVANMTVAVPQTPWNMGWCLDCHKSRAPEKVAKLTDCSTCHK